jgi:predicted nucleotidyltransferase component of viral defense system
MDLKDIRRLVIIALFSDDELMEKFVLKGGNALDLIYSIGTRSSVDIDISMPDDFDDIEDAKARIFRGLKERFDAEGFVVFDEEFKARPSRVRPGQSPRWGGYEIEFKIASRPTYEAHKHDKASLQRNAFVTGPDQKRRFKVDISKFEFCEPKEERELESFTIYVYTLPMMAIEKLRAICQQMEEYELRPYSKPRARDFYDIHTILKSEDVDLTTTENIELLKSIFAAKEVPTSLLSKISKTRDFHETDWPAVMQTVSGDLKPFKFYFDFVVKIVKRLKARGVK